MALVQALEDDYQSLVFLHQFPSIVPNLEYQQLVDLYLAIPHQQEPFEVLVEEQSNQEFHQAVKEQVAIHLLAEYAEVVLQKLRIQELLQHC